MRKDLSQNFRLRSLRYLVIVLETKEYTVAACSSEHGVKAFAYLFREYDRPGEFYPEKALQMGVPRGTHWHELQHGHDVNYWGENYSCIRDDRKAKKRDNGRNIW